VTTIPHVHDALIVGGGPAGLGVAIACHQAKLDYQVLEKGVLVNSMFHFPSHMTFFTTSDLLEIGGLPFVSPYEKPTRAEGLRYYRRVVQAYDLKVVLGEEVSHVRPSPEGGYVVESVRGGTSRQRRARNLIFATGYYDHPNFLGVPGEDLPHVSHYYTEPHACFRKDVVVVGGKNSAAIAALELFRAGARVTLVHRGAQLSESIKYWIRPDILNRIKEGSIPVRLETCLREITGSTVLVEGPHGGETLPADQVFLLTGYHPDPRLLQEAGTTVDPQTLVPTHDPETLMTDAPGVYLAGSVASGRHTSRIFIETGRFHGEAIARAIVQRRERNSSA
jgi:thioredoxin reductase (NADPH)